MTSVANLIRDARLRQGLTQGQLADAAGVSQTTIDKIEHGHTKRSRHLGKIVKVLNIVIPAELSDTDWPLIDQITNTGTKIERAPGFVEPLAPTQTPLVPSRIKGDSVGTFFSKPFVNIFHVEIVPEQHIQILRPRLVDDDPSCYGLYISFEFMSPELEPGDVGFFSKRLPVLVNMTGIFYNKSIADQTMLIGRTLEISGGHRTIRCHGDQRTLRISIDEYPDADRLVAKYARG